MKYEDKQFKYKDENNAADTVTISPNKDYCDDADYVHHHHYYYYHNQMMMIVH